MGEKLPDYANQHQIIVISIRCIGMQGMRKPLEAPLRILLLGKRGSLVLWLENLPAR